ncbi:uncharacterized protein [Anabrus simplex]|uniref:uncharacterized protein n=1 Tax=Anabrus simplex TaxID=316456 RepID=UPI0034DD0743
MVLHYKLVVILVVCWSVAQGHEMSEVLSRKLRYVVFPDTSTIGVFLAVAIPLDLPNKDVSVSWNFEANYNLPHNATDITPGLVVPARSIRSMRTVDRRRTYAMLERKFESEGLNGRDCLLRTICETSEMPLYHNGLLGDLMHVIFTPSSSADEGLPPDFDDAENMGKSGANCRQAYPGCPTGLYDFISEIDY